MKIGTKYFKKTPLVSWGSLCCELPVNHYITIHSMNIVPQKYIRVVHILIVVELWWFNVVGPCLRAICNIATPGKRADIFLFCANFLAIRGSVYSVYSVLDWVRLAVDECRSNDEMEGSDK